MNKVLISRILLIASACFLLIAACWAGYSISQSDNSGNTDSGTSTTDKISGKTDDELRSYLNSVIEEASKVASSGKEEDYVKGLSSFDQQTDGASSAITADQLAEIEFAKARYMANNNYGRQAAEILIPLSENEKVNASIRYRINLFLSLIYRRLGDAQTANQYRDIANSLGDFGVGEDLPEENQ
jgi:hypothetical protein